MCSWGYLTFSCVSRPRGRGERNRRDSSEPPPLLKYTLFYQCSGSVSGSTETACFWASRIRIHYSGVWIRLRILLSSSRRNLDSYCFATFKNYVNIPSKSKKKKNFSKKICFLLASWRSMRKMAGSGFATGFASISQRHGPADPDPHQNVINPDYIGLQTEWNIYRQLSYPSPLLAGTVAGSIQNLILKWWPSSLLERWERSRTTS